MPVDRMLANLDLNLLVTLDTLLRERNVTRTAEALGVSQPAVSAALARLRRHFGDPLLARAGNRYELTPVAAQLAALTAFAPAAQQLRLLGIEPRVEVVADGFLPMPFLVAGTRRVALLQERLAARLATPAGVRVMPCPFDVVPLAEAFWWHPIYSNDPAHLWLRGVLAAAGQELAGSIGVRTP